MESSRYLLYYSHGLATFGKKYYFLLLFWLQCLILGLFCVGPDFLFQIQLNEWWRWKKKIYLPCVFFRKILIFGWFWYLLITVNLGSSIFSWGDSRFSKVWVCYKRMQIPTTNICFISFHLKQLNSFLLISYFQSFHGFPQTFIFTYIFNIKIRETWDLL